MVTRKVINQITFLREFSRLFACARHHWVMFCFILSKSCVFHFLNLPEFLVQAFISYWVKVMRQDTFVFFPVFQGTFNISLSRVIGYRCYVDNHYTWRKASSVLISWKIWTWVLQTGGLCILNGYPSYVSTSTEMIILIFFLIW